VTESRDTLVWLVLVIGIALAGVGTAQYVSAPRLPDAGSVPVAHPATGADLGAVAASSPGTGSDATSGAWAGTASAVEAEPTWLRVPTQQVEAPVTAVGVQPGGQLTVPEDPQVLGWWRGGARPGSSRGTVVIDGHVDSRVYGTGALFYLSKLEPGATLMLGTTSGTKRYQVRAVHAYPKAELPSEVFDTTGTPRLVLITCGGVFNKDTRQYSDNIVAYAVPIEG
jgi:hypothetical protein